MLGFAPTIAMSAARPPSVHVRHVSSHQDLAQALAVRKRVFVDEMGISTTQEFDAFDAWPVPTGIAHYLVLVDTRPIATCRVNTVGIPGAKLERMAVDKVARRNGVGLALLKHIERAKLVEESRGPFYCFVMKHKELFYRNSGWVVEEGHVTFEVGGIPHVAMIKRRRPRGAGNPDGSMSHIMVRTWDIVRARRFYSLLGYQDITRFLTNGLKAAWIQSQWIDQRIELIEVKNLVVDKTEPTGGLSSLKPGLGHISLDLSRCCTDLSRFLVTIQSESLKRFRTKLRLLEKPREIMLGATVTEVAFMTDADGTVLELMRFVRKVEGKIEYDAQW